MKTTKKLEDLMRVLNQQTLIAEAAKAKADAARAELFALMQEEGEAKVTTDDGVALMVEGKDFDLTGFPEVAELAALHKQAKKEAEAQAPFTIKHTLRFTPNRAKEVPQTKTKKIWKTRVILKQGTIR